MNERQHKKKLAIMSKLYPDVKNIKENEGIGDLVMFHISPPCIEIAEDGKTAKGLWFSQAMGCEIGADGRLAIYGFWGREGVDFIKEDGKWKIWHLLLTGDIRYRQDQHWVDNINPPFERTVQDEQNMKQDMLRKIPHRYYSNKTLPQDDPKIPEPYETWEESISYLK